MKKRVAMLMAVLMIIGGFGVVSNTEVNAAQAPLLSVVGINGDEVEFQAILPNDTDMVDVYFNLSHVHSFNGMEIVDNVATFTLKASEGQLNMDMICRVSASALVHGVGWSGRGNEVELIPVGVFSDKKEVDVTVGGRSVGITSSNYWYWSFATRGELVTVDNIPEGSVISVGGLPYLPYEGSSLTYEVDGPNVSSGGMIIGINYVEPTYKATLSGMVYDIVLNDSYTINYGIGRIEVLTGEEGNLTSHGYLDSNNPSPGLWAQKNMELYLEEGTKIWFVPEANQGYEFYDWTGNITPSGLDPSVEEYLPNPYYVVMPVGELSHTATAAFRLIPERYTVTFDANGGWFGEDTSSTSVTALVEEGQAVTVPGDINNSWDKEFAKWDLGEGQDLNNVDHSFTVYADWYNAIPLLIDTMDSVGFPDRVELQGIDIDGESGDYAPAFEWLHGTVYSLSIDEELTVLDQIDTTVYTTRLPLTNSNKVEIPYNPVSGYKAKLYAFSFGKEYSNGESRWVILDADELYAMDINHDILNSFVHDEVNHKFVLEYSDNDVHLHGIGGMAPLILYVEDEVVDVPEETEEEPVTKSSTPTTYYSIVLGSTEGGSVTPYEGEKDYPSGIVIMDVVTTAEEGYEFVGFSGDVDKYVDGRFDLDGNLELIAEFALVEEELEDEEVAEEGADEAAVEEDETEVEVVAEEETANNNIEKEVTNEDETVDAGEGGLAGNSVLDGAQLTDEALPEAGGVGVLFFLGVGAVVTGVGVKFKKK